MIVALCISQNYKKFAMKQSVLVITTVMILLGGVIAITLIQSTEATAINTTRSNIKSAAKKEVKGNDNQLSEQDANVNQYSIVENNCGDGADCSGLATNTNGDIQSPKSEVSLDTSISVDGDSNVFADTDPIPGVDVKLGHNIR
jgi:hypothetical protein